MDMLEDGWAHNWPEVGKTLSWRELKTHKHGFLELSTPYSGFRWALQDGYFNGVIELSRYPPEGQKYETSIRNCSEGVKIILWLILWIFVNLFSVSLWSLDLYLRSPIFRSLDLLIMICWSLSLSPSLTPSLIYVVLILWSHSLLSTFCRFCFFLT